MIWVIVADSNHCRIYSYHRKPLHLKLIKEIAHDEIKHKKSEYLTSDRPGHYQTKDTARGAYSPHTDPKEIELIKFAREISRFTNQSRIKRKYNKLIMIAEPHMSGVILQQLDKNVESLIIKNIKKDYMHITDKDLLTYLQHEIFNS